MIVCAHAKTYRIHNNSLQNIFHAFNFCGWGHPRKCFFNSENFPIYGTCTFTTQTTVAVLQQSNRTLYEGRRGQQKCSLYQFKFLKWLFWSAGVSRNLHRIFVYVCKADAKNFVVTPTYFCPIRGVLTYFHCTLWSKRVPRCADKCMHGFWWISYDFKALLSPKIF